MRKLKAQGHISPFFFNRLPAGGSVAKGIVFSGDQRLCFVECEAYPDGTEVTIHLSGRDFVCESLDDAEIRKAAMVKQREEIQRTYADNRRRYEEQVKRFNDSLGIPVQWKPEIKPVVSGLLEQSMGNGMRRNTVYHVMLLEPLHEGRLERDACQPLCGGDWGSFGELLNWQEPTVDAAKVSCKRCLDIAKRWQKGEQ